MKPEVDYTLYLVTDRGLMSTPTLEEAVGQAVEGGATLVQLREKTASSLEFFRTAEKIKRITDARHIPLIVNDRADIALAADAAGVHIGQSDLPAKAVRAMIGRDKILGVSASNLEEAVQAERDGADYLGVGAMFATGTKTDARPVPLEELKRIREAVRLPIVVIGGINRKTAPLFAGTGIDGIAVVSALIAAKDIAGEARELKALSLRVRGIGMPDFKAAIFDLDGTLLDSMGVWEKIDVDFLAKRGLPVPETYTQEVCSKSFPEAAAYTIALFGLKESAEDVIADWNRMAIDEYSRRIRLKPHAGEYLLFLKERGVRLGTATALPRALYEPALRNNGVYDLFDAFASVDEVSRGKESPELYLLAAKRLGVAPADCAVFEDVLRGIRGIKAAGMRAFGVYDRYSEHEEAQIRELCERHITDFAELMPAPASGDAARHDL